MERSSKPTQFYTQQQMDSGLGTHHVMNSLHDNPDFSTVSLPEGFTLHQTPASAALVSSASNMLPSSLNLIHSSHNPSGDSLILNTSAGLDTATLTQLLTSTGNPVSNMVAQNQNSVVSFMADVSSMLSEAGDSGSTRDLHPILAATLESVMQGQPDSPPPDPLPLAPDAMTITVQCTLLDTVIVVGQQNWQCCMCRDVNGFDVSIDQHMALKHDRQLGPTAAFSQADDIKVPQGLLNSAAMRGMNFSQQQQDQAQQHHHNDLSQQHHQNLSQKQPHQHRHHSVSFGKGIHLSEPLQTISEQALASLKIPEEQSASTRSGLEREVAMLMAHTFPQSGQDRAAAVRNSDAFDDLAEENGIENVPRGSGKITLGKMINKVEKAMWTTSDDEMKTDLMHVAKQLNRMRKDNLRPFTFRRRSRYTLCPVCGKLVRNRKDYMKQHYRCHEATKTYRCLICNKVFKYMHTLKRHVVKQGHEGGLPPQPSQDQAADHQSVLSIDYITEADSCMSDIKMEHEIEQQEEEEEEVNTSMASANDNDNVVSLEAGKPAYEKILAMFQAKGAQARTPAGKKLTLVQCFVCDKEVRNRNYYIQRHARCHLDALCYVCRICNKEFYRSDHYRQHAETHENEEAVKTPTQSSVNLLMNQAAKRMISERRKLLRKANSLKCNICNKNIFNKSFNIKRHALSVHSIQDWTSIVGKNSPKQNSLQKSLSQSSLVSCRLCAKSLVNKPSILKNHAQSAHSTDDWKSIVPQSHSSPPSPSTTVAPGVQCMACSQTFKTYALKRRHMLLHRSSFWCNRCEAKFETGANLFSHSRTCLNHPKGELGANVSTPAVEGVCKTDVNKEQDGKKFKCPVCKASILNTRQSISIHMRELHSEGQPHKCDECGKVFDSYHKLQRHRKWHADKGGICDTCGKVFMTRIALQKHTKLHAGAEGMFQCPRCPRSFRFQRRLEKHLEKHLQKANNCPHCGKVYLSKVHLKRHITVEHYGVKDYRFKCSECGAQFFENIQLRDHVAYQHRGIQLYKCRYCGQGFNCRPTMIRHERKQHTSDLPYKCKHCDLGFAEKSRLVAHEMTVTGVSPHQCEICCKYFTTSSALRAHRHVHFGVKRFSCSLCPKTFLKSWHLQQHVKKSHPNESHDVLTNTSRTRTATRGAGSSQNQPTPDDKNQAVAVPVMVYDPQGREVLFQAGGSEGLAGRGFIQSQSGSNLVPVVDASTLFPQGAIDAKSVDIKFLQHTQSSMPAAPGEYKYFDVHRSADGTITIAPGSGTVTLAAVSVGSEVSPGLGLQGQAVSAQSQDHASQMAVQSDLVFQVKQ